ncbi:hypothetical protein GPJ56_002225 [Histomonas meleagridis]|uniref:uncharacterized protein n=1 Tax=Histomonas meleagridis TaxID=135588 RepID=UPI00355A8295|nr:hypothetical protein GPJ56_002225 [Histomonas meleagridis]KAH0796130.1 hypothetical protein GO595_011097 [Histomonas meleagridis]
MIALFSVLSLAFVDQDVCSLFSFDPQSCVSYLGCRYCVETHSCYSAFNYDGTPSKKCPSTNSMTGKHGGLGTCFTLFTDDGCQKCVSNDANKQCGWCEGLGICAEGDASGPFGLKCLSQDWLFNTTKCKKSTCASAKSKDKCIHPCKWSKRNKVCYRPRKIAANSEIEESQSQAEVEKTQRVLIGCVIAFFVCAVVAIVVGIWYFKRPLYTKLPLMSNNISLDQLPSQEI